MEQDTYEPDSEASQSEALQDEGWVFNFNGYGFRHGIEDRQKHATIKALTPANKTLNMAMKTKKHDPVPKFPCLDEHLKGEPMEDGEGEAFLVVGLAVPGYEVPRGKDLSSHVGTGPPRQNKTVTTEHLNKGLTVVILIKGSNGKTPKFYALLHTDDSLLQPYKLSKHQVFWFSEFRSSGPTTDSGREKKWTKTALAGLEASHHDEDENIRKPKPSDVEEKMVHVEQEEAFLNKLKLLMLDLQQQPTESKIAEALQLLCSVENDQGLPHASTSHNLRRFLQRTEHFETQEAEQLIQEARTLWVSPVPALLTPELVISLKAAIEHEDIFIEYSSLENFLRQATGIVEDQHLENDGDTVPFSRPLDYAVVARSAHKIVKRYGEGLYHPPTQANMGRYHQVFITMCSVLRQIDDGLRDSHEAVMDIAGGQATDWTIEMVWEKLRTAHDEDTLKLAFSQGLRVMYGSTPNAYAGVREYVRSVRRILDRLMA